METFNFDSESPKNKRKILIAAGVSLTLFGSVWVGLKLFSPSKEKAEFVISTDGAAVTNENLGPGADGEVLAVVNDIESGLQQEDAAFKNPKVQLLSEIIEMGLTDDQAMLDELKNLTDEDKLALKTFYRQLENEDRNGRGITVYLIGQNLSSAEDLKFFEDVIRENPCLSLDNCQEPDQDDADESEARGPAGEPTTILAYPQIMAVRSLEASLNKAQGEFRSKLLDLISQAAQNPNSEVQKAARAALKGF